MSTSIEANMVRPRLNFGSFAHITAVPLVEFDRDGLLFDGALTDNEVGACWWYATSTDDVDQARREEIAALRSAAAADPSLANVAALVVKVATHLLGDGA